MAQWLFNLRGPTGYCEIVSDGPLTLCEFTDVLNKTDITFCFSLRAAKSIKDKHTGENGKEQIKVKNCGTLVA